MLLMSQWQLTIANQLLKIKNNQKRVIDYGGTFLICQAFNSFDYKGSSWFKMYWLMTTKASDG